MPLSDAKLRNLLNKKDQLCVLSHRDGLRVKRNKNGAVLWQYRCRYKGTQVIMGLGHYPQLGLKDAQDLVPHLKGWVAQGLDPRVEYKKFISPPEENLTVSRLAEQWLEIKVPTLKPKTQVLYQNHVKKWIMPYLEVALDTMTVHDWVAYFKTVSDNGSAKMASVMLVRLKTILRWAIMRGDIAPQNPIFNLQANDVGEPAAQGQRYLRFNELALLWREIESAKATPASKACLQMIFLTGARQSEVRLMRWEDLDFDNMIWTVPPENSKTNKAIRRPITKKMQSMLDQLALVYGKTGVVIPGSTPAKSLTTHSVNRFCARIWANLNRKHNMAKFLPHDARRSVSTLLSELEVPPACHRKNARALHARGHGCLQ